MKSNKKNLDRINESKNQILAISCLSCNIVGNRNTYASTLIYGAINNDKKRYG